MAEKIEFFDFDNQYIDEVFRIENENILEAWSRENIASLLGDSKARARVGVIGNKVVCYYSYYAVCQEGFINNLAVDKEYQHKGIGRLLMQDMIEIARADNLTGLTLEVQEDNERAIALYQKSGFEIEGRRKEFYKNKKDALIMWYRKF